MMRCNKLVEECNGCGHENIWQSFNGNLRREQAERRFYRCYSQMLSKMRTNNYFTNLYEIHIEEGICGEGGCEQAHVWAVDGAARCRASPPGRGEARQTGVAHGGAADSVVVWDWPARETLIPELSHPLMWLNIQCWAFQRIEYHKVMYCHTTISKGGKVQLHN